MSIDELEEKEEELEKLKLELIDNVLRIFLHSGITIIGALQFIQYIQVSIKNNTFVTLYPILISLLNALFADVYLDNFKTDIKDYHKLKLGLKINNEI